MKRFGSTSGLTVLAEDQATPANGMSALLTSTYNTGWMNGDIKGAFLSDTDDTDLVGGTDNDRSVNGNDLTVNGTVSRTPVATGAEMVGYSGFSVSNYLEQPYNSDLDFGTGDFCVMGWVNLSNPAVSQYIVDRYDNASGPRIALACVSSLWYFAASASGGLSNTGVSNKSGWAFISLLRKSATLYFYVDGTSIHSVANTVDLDNTDAVFSVGKQAGGSAPLAGSLALWRISATAPTAEQIAKIYNDEKLLFQPNAACTLYGASDAVTALAHDPETDLLHVGTSAGRSVFKGLRRINNTTAAVTTAISAVDGLIGEQ